MIIQWHPNGQLGRPLLGPCYRFPAVSALFGGHQLAADGLSIAFRSASCSVGLNQTAQKPNEIKDAPPSTR
jgi:hypothetical protein